MKTVGDNNTYSMVAIKREWIPDWLYAAVVKTLRPLCIYWPLRQILHRELNAREMQEITQIPEIENKKKTD